MAYTDNDSNNDDQGRSSKKAFLESIAPLGDTLYNKLFKDYITTKNYKRETLLTHGIIQAQCIFESSHKGKKRFFKSSPVIAVPMGSAYHCVMYPTYPKEPRFVNAGASEQEAVACLSLLGIAAFNSAAPIIFLTEGLWDMLTLYEMGYHVLGLPGVNNLEEAWCEVFRGKQVIICFDNDAPGRKYAEQHSRLIAAFAASVKVLILPTTATFSETTHSIKDITDLANVDRALADSTLQSLVDSTPEIVLNVRERIQEIITAKGNDVQKSIIITDLIIHDINQNGGKIIPYNKDQEFAIILGGVNILTDELIDIYLRRSYEYIPSQALWRQVRDRLHARALLNHAANVCRNSFTQGDSCFIGTRRHGIIEVHSQHITVHPQGVQDIYIQTSNPIDPANVVSLLSAPPPIKETSLESLLHLFFYEGDDAVNRFLLKTWFYQSFFDPQMRVILCITGDPGSGKTLLLKIFKGILFGFSNGRNNPNSMPDEDYVFTSMMKEYRYLFIDEVNENDPKMKSKFRMLATGEETIFRPKYAKDHIRFRPRLWLAVSAHSPKFRENDIAQRLCLIKLSHPESQHVKLIDETALFELLESKREEIWASMLKELQKIVQNLALHSQEYIPLKNYCRQVEMANFAWRAWPKERELCLKTFEGINMRQENFASEFDPLMDLLDQQLNIPGWGVRENGHIKIGAKQLRELMAALAKELGVRSFPASTAGFAKWLHSRQKVLHETFGYERHRDVHRNQYTYSFTAPLVPEHEGKEVF